MPAGLRGAVVALGNFDGFHVGHQAVVGRALALARATGRPALVATFDPHPARLFRPDAPPFLLSTIDQRAELFAAFGMDGTIVLPFDRAMAAVSPEGFVADWLAARIGATARATPRRWRRSARATASRRRRSRRSRPRAASPPRRASASTSGPARSRRRRGCSPAPIRSRAASSMATRSAAR